MEKSQGHSNKIVDHSKGPDLWETKLRRLLRPKCSQLFCKILSIYKPLFFMSTSIYWGTYCFLPCLLVCWSVCWSVCANFNIGHNFFNIEDSNLIFGMLVYLMELHILSGERSRSRSSFKVKGQIYGSKSLESGHSVSQTHLVIMSTSIYWGTYCFCPVCWFVGLFVGLFAPTLTLAITFSILKIAT